MSSSEMKIAICPDPKRPRECGPAKALAAMLAAGHAPRFVEAWHDAEGDTAEGHNCHEVAIALMVDLWIAKCRDPWFWIEGTCINSGTCEPFEHSWIECGGWVLDASAQKLLFIEAHLYREMTGAKVHRKRSIKQAGKWVLNRGGLDRT